jgi:UDP-N-acetylglucosamine 4,6-dehydratase
MLDDKAVLVTGGTGSFGRKFVEVVLARYRPKKLIVFSRDELKQHEMRQVFPDGSGSPMRYFIGDVRDRERLYRAFAGVDIVVHAAALKQVPACEYNPFEAVQTNIVGAKNVIDAAIDQEVQRVIAISTDKAVNPLNLYGATKLCAEKLFVQGNYYSRESGPHFTCARYGNVVGSRGSVVPVFLEQQKNGTLTITDPRMTRFWITLEQGVEFVIQCILAMRGGEIFVPKIPSMNILEMAQAIAPHCQVEYIGIRPGEKVHEVLISSEEARQTVELEDMYVIEPQQVWLPGGRLDAKPVPEGFRYASDTNSRWLSAEELRLLVGM